MDEEAATAEAGLASKRLKSQPPDLKVVVGGSGDDNVAQEFDAYSVLLCHHSPYFDTMLSTQMKENKERVISFPNKDPAVWQLFYSVIDPRGEAVITNDNVLTLLPWFHEFMMEAHVKLCEDCLAGSYFKDFHLHIPQDIEYWNPLRQEVEDSDAHTIRLKQRKNEFTKIIEVLQVAMEYELRYAKLAAEQKVAALMKCLACTYDLFDFPTVKFLIQCIPPLEKTNVLNVKEGERWFGKSHLLWLLFFQKIVSHHASMLTQEMLDDEACFSALVYSYFQIEVEKKRGEEKLNAAKSIIRTFVDDAPRQLYSKMPHAMSTTNEYIDDVARDNLYDIIESYQDGKHRENFKKIGLGFPRIY